jgi:dTDP-4-amino-4,6-dideoxygalactose transaminase
MTNLRALIDATAPAWQRHLEETFESGQFILGRQVSGFEREFAAYLRAAHAIGVASGTDALELSLRCAGVMSAGQEVLTSPVTSPYTALAILAAGATPRFADVDPRTLLLDPDDAGRRMGPNTAALIPVHLYGQPCALGRFALLARQSGAVLIQDACQAHGARFHRQPLAEYSSYLAYSFYPTKNLGCLGDGGAVVTHNPAIAERLRLLRDGGRRNDQISCIAGINSRLDELQACYLRAFLPHLDDWNAHRRQVAVIYDELLSGLENVHPIDRGSESVCHLYVIRARHRDALRRHLAERGIATGVHYPVPLHLQPAFQSCGLKAGDLPHAERACGQILSLPIWPYMSESIAERVAQAIRRFSHTQATNGGRQSRSFG